VIRATTVNNVVHFRDSKPCKHCIEIIRRCRIKSVTYSSGDGEFITEKVCNMYSNHVSFGRRK